MWMLISIYQGGVLMYGSLILFHDEFIHIVAITFTALIFTELCNVATEVTRFHWGMGISEVVTAVIYLLSVMALDNYFDLDYIFSVGFIWRVVAITVVAWVPVHMTKWLANKLDPPEESKV